MEKLSRGITLLTVVVFILSSIIYWSTYAHLIPVASILDQPDVYEQFMYKLSAIPACGGYSALAVCPDDRRLGLAAVQQAGHKLNILTPLIWTFSTLMLLVLLGWQVYQRRLRPHQASPQAEDTGSKPASNVHQPVQTNRSQRSKYWTAFFWIATAAFLAGMGMQLSLLSNATSLKMMDWSDWSFGQIVAVTIWFPPWVEFYYGIIGQLVSKKLKRKTSQQNLGD